MGAMMKDFLAGYGAIIIGVIIGAMAHFGRIITDHGWPGLRQVIGFVMQLGLVALIAALLTQQLGVDDDLMRSATASVLTVATNEVLRWARLKAAKMLDLVGIETVSKGDDPF